MLPNTLIGNIGLISGQTPATHQVSFSKFATPYSLLLQANGWARLNSRIPNLSSGMITRAQVTSCFAANGGNSPDYEVAFIACMLWGFGIRNKSGPVKTWIGLQGKSFSTIMAKAEGLLQGGDFGRALMEVTKIDEIGTAFGSKILYFMGCSLRLSPMPLVFDSVVCASLVAIFGKSDANKLFGIVRGLPPGISDLRGYQAYCDAMNGWAASITGGCTADQIELFLFGEKKNLVKAYKSKGSPLG